MCAIRVQAPVTHVPFVLGHLDALFMGYHSTALVADETSVSQVLGLDGKSKTSAQKNSLFLFSLPPSFLMQTLAPHTDGIDFAAQEVMLSNC